MEDKDIRVHQIWLGLQAWEKVLAIFIPMAIGLGSGVSGAAFAIGMFKQKIEMTVDNHGNDLKNMHTRVDAIESQVHKKVDYAEFYETKKKADESREALIKMEANLDFIKNTTDRTLTEIEKIRDRR